MFMSFPLSGNPLLETAGQSHLSKVNSYIKRLAATRGIRYNMLRMLQYYPLCTISLESINAAVGAIDTAAFKLINGSLARPWLDGIMVIATTFGVGTVQAGLSLGLVLFGLVKDKVNVRRAGYAGLIAFAASGVAVQVAKFIWHRPRPLLALFDVHLVDVPRFTHSFPSGHSMTAFAVAVAISIFLPRLRYILIPIALATGLSRIYLGVHYPLDVTFGAFVGVLIGILSARQIQPLNTDKSSDEELVSANG